MVKNCVDRSAVVTEGLLHHIARIDAGLPALDDGTLKLTFGELIHAVRAEQQWLMNHGVMGCALAAQNGAAWVISDLAMLDQGVINIPLPGYFTVEQQRHVLNDAALAHAITDDPVEFQKLHPDFRSVGRSPAGLTLLRRHSDRAPYSAAGTAKITYTSGSTGTPKGVCLPGSALDAVTRSLVDATASLNITRHMCLLPLPTLLENIAGIYVPLVLGAETIVMPSSAIGMSYGRMDLPKLLDAIRRTAPQSLVLVPELLRALILAARSGWQPPSTLRFIAVGGATVAVELLEQARALGLPVFEGYGLSECASVVCLNTPDANRPGSVGRPLAHARVRVDASGQIWVGGAIMSGYLGDAPVPTDEVATGDLGHIDVDGFVYVRGRAKNMFITSMGRNVAPEWVERELTCEPVIAQAMVTGEARPFAVALISTHGSATNDAIDAAIARANSRLPAYAHIARWARFPETPTFAAGLATANGRLRRDSILQRFGAFIESLYTEEHPCHAIP